MAPGTAAPVLTASAAVTIVPAPTAIPRDATGTVSAVALRPARHSSARGLEATGAGEVVVLRNAATADARVVAQAPGARVLWVEGRTVDGAWLWVSYDEAGRHAWAAAADLRLSGDPSPLPVVLRGTAATPTATPTDAPRIANKPTRLPPTATPTATTVPPTARPRAATPAPTTVPAAGRLVIQPSIGEIYLMNADGTGLRRLTNGMDPAFSPDGQRIAFARWGPPDGVYILDLRTGQEQRVTLIESPRGPTWSPDAAHLAFSRVSGQVSCLDTPLGCFTEEVIRDFFGGKECIDTPQGRYCISDFPMRVIDRTLLAEASTIDGTWVDVASQEGAQSATWHPARNEILYKGSSGLQVVTPGEQTRPLSDNRLISSPVWSPDGTRIAAQVHVHDHWEIFVLDANGNTIARLTEPAPLSPRAPHNVAPAWSPDGNTILFLTDREGPWRLYQTNLDGSNQIPFQPQALSGLTFNYSYAAERVVSWSK